MMSKQDQILDLARYLDLILDEMDKGINPAIIADFCYVIKKLKNYRKEDYRLAGKEGYDTICLGMLIFLCNSEHFLSLACLDAGYRKYLRAK